MKPNFSSGHPASTLIRSLLFLGLLSPLASAKVAHYQYFRFHPLKLQGATDQVQLAEFQFFNGSTKLPITGVLVTDPGPPSPAGAAEGPDKAFDNLNSTKWLDNSYTQAYLTFNFGAAVDIDSYNYVTANDSPTRDPVSWMIEGSADGENWVLLDNIANTPAVATRYQLVSATNFVFPDNPRPLISAFELADPFGSAIVPNSTPVSLYASTAYATSAKITNDADATQVTVAVPGDQYPSVAPPNNRDTVYTLNASSGGAPSTKSIVLRSVQPQAQNYQYVRYTPKKVRNGGTSVQLATFTFSSASAAVIPVSVTSTGSSPAGQDVSKLIDTDSTTKWSSPSLTPVVFNFGSKKSFDAYNFTTSDNVDQDPVQWVMEGSDDNSTWTLIDNVTSFDFPTSSGRLVSLSTDIPIPGSNVSPAAGLTASSSFLLAGDPLTLTYSTVGAASITITPGVTTTNLNGSVTVNPQTTTTYTLTATSTSGKTSSKSVTVTVATPTGAINYTNFNTAPDINLIGSAQIVNDFATFPNSPNAKRLRLTSLGQNQAGTAWSISKMKLTDGFQTAFDAHLSFPVYVNGADGIAFVIQNAAANYSATPDSGFTFNSKAVTVILDSFPDADGNGETQANLEIYRGTTQIALVNLDQNGKKVAKGYKGTYLVNQPTNAPYHVQISYASGSLSVTIDGTPIVTVAVDLVAAGAADSSGKSWVGFTAKTRNIVAYQDIENWTLTPAGSVATTPLAITNSAFTFGTTPQASLTFSSTAGKTYQVTQSADLTSWQAVGSTVTATAASTTVNVPFTPSSKGFFRVEQTN